MKRCQASTGLWRCLLPHYKMELSIQFLKMIYRQEIPIYLADSYFFFCHWEVCALLQYSTFLPFSLEPHGKKHTKNRPACQCSPSVLKRSQLESWDSAEWEEETVAQSLNRQLNWSVDSLLEIYPSSCCPIQITARRSLIMSRNNRVL